MTSQTHCARIFYSVMFMAAAAGRRAVPVANCGWSQTLLFPLSAVVPKSFRRSAAQLY